MIIRIAFALHNILHGNLLLLQLLSQMDGELRLDGHGPPQWPLRGHTQRRSLTTDTTDNRPPRVERLCAKRPSFSPAHLRLGEPLKGS